MEIRNEITKDVFEKYVPVAKMAEHSDSVFRRMEAAFDKAYKALVRDTIGPTFVAAIESNTDAKENIIAIVCITAFVQMARSLDLVLTATGFGIVSTDSTAPASKTRVDNMLDENRLSLYERWELLIRSLSDISGWSVSPQAVRSIGNLFWRISLLELTTLEHNADKWLWALGQSVDADRMIREAISDDLVNCLLDMVRANSLCGYYADIADMAERVMATLISMAADGSTPNKRIFDQMVDFVESHAEELPEYKDSKVYRCRHHQPIKNESGESSFFFM